jgi:anti-anti-sigma factor
MNGASLKFELRDAGSGIVVVTCHGGLSWEDRELLAAAVEQQLAQRDSFSALVMDMHDVSFVNSAGLGALFQLVQRVHQRDAGFVFAGLPGAIRHLFVTVGLDRVAQFADDVNEALRFLAETPQQ